MNIKEIIIYFKKRSLLKAKEKFAYWHGMVEAYEAYTLKTYDADDYRKAKGNLRKYEIRIKLLTEELKELTNVSV